MLAITYKTPLVRGAFFCAYRKLCDLRRGITRMVSKAVPIQTCPEALAFDIITF